MSGFAEFLRRLYTVKCYNCVSAEKQLGFSMLPSDCVTSPVLALCFRDEDDRPTSIEMRVVCGAPEIFVQQSAVIKSATTRHVYLSKHPVFKKDNQTFYRVDGDLVARLKTKQSRVTASAVNRIEEIQRNVALNGAAMVDAYKAKVERARGESDVEQIVSVMDWCMRTLGERGLLQQVFDSQGKAYGLLQAAAAPAPDPNSKIYEYRSAEFWDCLFKEARGLFGVRDPDQFKRDQILGKRRSVAKEIVPHRPSIHKYVIHFPDSHVWDGIDREWSTINRVMWEAEHTDPAAAASFAARFDQDVLKAIGFGRPYVMRTEKTSATGITRHACALDFLRFGFYSAVVHLCTHQTRNFRRAVMDKNYRSLTAKLLECHSLSDAEIKEIGFLNVAYARLLDAATRNISVKQRSKTTIKQGLPSAFEVLRLMHRLDTGSKTKETKMLLCFLGLAYYCGFRSADIGRLMVPDYKAKHTGHHTLLVTDTDGRMWMGSTKCKTVADDLKVLVLPEWLRVWVDDWVEARAEFHLLPAHGEPPNTRHSGMWLTATGKAVDHGAGGCPHKNSNFLYMFSVLHAVAPELAKVTCFTDLRSIFFDGSSVQVSGSMMNLFANAQEYLPAKNLQTHEGLRTDVLLAMQDDIRSAVEKLNRSKSQPIYTDNRLAPLPFVADYYDAVKRFVWANL